MADARAKRNEHEGKYLTFVLGQEEYGISIRHVQEIIGMLPVTPVPGSPSDILGVVNLRGKIVPITDLRQKFGILTSEATKETCIVVVVAHGVATGIIADRVREVTEVRGDSIEAPPSFGLDVDISHVLGIATLGGGARILLDIEKVLPGGSLAA